MMEWSDGVCDCQSDCGSCWLTCCCPCITQMQNINKLPEGSVPFFGSSDFKINGPVYLVIFFLMCAAGGTTSALRQTAVQSCMTEKAHAREVEHVKHAQKAQAALNAELESDEDYAFDYRTYVTPHETHTRSASHHMMEMMDCMNESSPLKAAESLLGLLDLIFTMGIFMGIVEALKIGEGPCLTCFKACCCWACYICQIHRHLAHHEGYCSAEDEMEMVGGPVRYRE
eukprot:gnl/TRDRNA2_/TRDRNA2_78251_c0_seq2.p1 gnl/TRDRNA2_/TRDRNA2_78251_c0~~gnl/TRDRNA2_/TRDRNA2_78251_c0_seq2.p1  ORF type:complete len:250 (-),score=40.01 gnl/TRDRNA2_/TRDRNA2_78251_c0_seq2:76-759(-)